MTGAAREAAEQSLSFDALADAVGIDPTTGKDNDWSGCAMNDLLSIADEDIEASGCLCRGSTHPI